MLFSIIHRRSWTWYICRSRTLHVRFGIPFYKQYIASTKLNSSANPIIHLHGAIKILSTTTSFQPSQCDTSAHLLQHITSTILRRSQCEDTTTMVTLTSEQMAVLVAIERSMACLSATATMLLLLTFLFFRELRTLPNTLIFLASPANLLASSAALIGGNGFNNLIGPTCQGQAFLLEW